ncbi:MAG: DUF6305 family protein [Clostridiales bacterium]|nr:DUF6305 family protein [Clostridiales bacterium]
MTQRLTVCLGLTFLLCSGAALSAVQNTTAVFEEPLLITSAGQNAEVQLAAVLAKRAGLDYILSKLATASDLENTKTLTLVLGASLKGLGAAGLDVDKERERVRALVTESQKRNIPILCLHLGGEARRGQQTDDLIAEFLTWAKMAIVVKSGNNDGFFTKICQAKNIPLIEVGKTADALEPLRKAFKR